MNQDPATFETLNAEIPPRPRWWRVGRAMLIYLLIPYLAIVLLFTLAQRRLMYHPTASTSLSVATAGFDAASASDLTLTTDDGLTLHGWLLRANAPPPPEAAADDASPAAAPLVIYFPGNASHRAGRAADLRDFTRLGCDVLIFDYRGYAENPGSPSESMMTADARAIWQLAVDDLNMDPDRIVLFGESMGGAVAIGLAAHLCEQQTPPAALITNATFDSMPSVARYHYPMFPFGWLVWDRWLSVDHIPAITCPVLMFHGTADQIVPMSNGRTLFAAAPRQSSTGIEKSFVEISGAGHNDIPISRLQDEVTALLAQIESSELTRK